jgi:hypothetical protein
VKQTYKQAEPKYREDRPPKEDKQYKKYEDEYQKKPKR